MKKYFITGLLIWIPLVITIWVLKLVVDVLEKLLLTTLLAPWPRAGDLEPAVAARAIGAA